MRSEKPFSLSAEAHFSGLSAQREALFQSAHLLPALPQRDPYTKIEKTAKSPKNQRCGSAGCVL